MELQGGNFELSMNQKRFWFLNKDDFQQLYTRISIEFPGGVHLEKLASALNKMMDTHETLSSKLVSGESSVFPLQAPLYYKNVPVEILPADSYENWMADWENKGKDSNPEATSPIQFFIFSDPQKNVTRLVYKVYSFWTDLFGSFKILENLGAVLNGVEISSPGDENFIIHRNFAAWQNELVNEKDNEGLNFWTNYTCSPGNKIIPFGKKRYTEFRPKRISLSEIRGDQFVELKASSAKTQIGMDLHFLSGLIHFLRNYEASKLTLGYVIFGRIYEVLNETVGLVSKTVPLEIDGHFDFNDKNSLQSLLDSIEKIKDWSDYYGANSFDTPEKSKFKVCFQYADATLPFQNSSAPSYIIEDVFNTQETFEIKLAVTHFEDRLTVELYYNENAFTDIEIAVLRDQLTDALRQTMAGSYFPARNSDVISTIVSKLNNCGTHDIDLDNSILDLIWKQTQAHPDSIAIQSESSQITYSELWKRTNSLANYLINGYGPVRGKAIAVLLHNPVDYIISMIGILKTGAFFVPLDASSPESRINFVLKDCNCSVLITEKAFEPQMDFSGKFLYYGSVSKLPLNPDYTHGSLPEAAYAIYTSGSSGFPKGVMVSHRSLTNYISWAKDYYSESNDLGNSGLFTSFSFDLTLTSIFVPLANGKTIFTQNEDLSVNEKLIRIFENPEIDLIKLTPSHINLLSALDVETKGPKIIICGGESLTMHQVQLLYKLVPGARIYNEYGPTEATVGCIVKRISPEDEQVLIGRPISNTKIKIVGKNGECSIGSIGEILIGGECLSLGYLNRPEETKHSFSALDGESQDLFYRSGDLGRLLPNGELEYIGRKDEQVKIRGYRVELGEIEFHLKNRTGVSDAAVIYKRNGLNEGELAAFIVSENNLLADEWGDYLKPVLPDYMIPRSFLKIEKIPLTPNGKTDKKALSDLRDIEFSRRVDYVAPRTEQEKVLVSVCADVLKREGIGTKDSFYNLGGDSIKSIQVVSRLKQQGYTLKVENILRTPVMEELAQLMQRTTRIIDQKEVQGEVELTPIQHWFFEDPEIKVHNHYNQSVLLKSKERLDKNILEKSVVELTKHHDALRMVYKRTEGGWKQINQDTGLKSHTLDFYDLSHSANAIEEMSQIGEQIQSSIEISTGPLFKAVHVRMKDGDRLGLIIHHLVVDGVSWRILLEDLSILYTSYKEEKNPILALKTDSFQRWALLQKEYAQGRKLQRERTYWEELCSREIERLPRDKEIKGDQITSVNASESFRLDKATTELLQTRVHRVYKTEINDVLLTGLGLAIKEVFSREKTVIKMEGHGREEVIGGVDISRTVGWFTTVYPFILDVSKTSDPAEALIEVKESLRKVPNKGIGYGMVNYLSGKTLESNIDPEIVFNYLGDFGSNAGNKENSIFDYASESIGSEISGENGNNTILDISGMLVMGELSMSVRYSQLRYDSITIQKLISSYEKNLKFLIEELSKEKETYLTPSDLSFKGLNIKELNEINAAGDVEDVYELSPLQEGIYYHWSSGAPGTLYFEQTSYRIKAKGLEIKNLKHAYEGLTARHGVLRTCFSNEYGGRSLQIVKKEVPGNFTCEKIKGKAGKHIYIEQIKQKDRERGFDLAGPSQMRLHIIDLEEGEYEFIWSHHHILMDGWCMSVLINDFNELLSGNALNLSPVMPYSNYINWMKTIDRESSLAYWKDYLSGYSQVAELPFKLKTEEKTYTESREYLLVEGGLFKKVDALCNQAGITHNTFMQGVWGYLLACYNNTNDVVFGAVVSGRPGELQGVEDMIGLFVNTIPVRVRYKSTDTPVELLKSLQEQSIQATSHHYVNLSEVQSLSEPGMNLIDHIMVFENYAVKELANEGVLNTQREEGLIVTSMEVFEQTNYDLNIMVGPSPTSLSIDIRYNTNRYNSLLIKRLTKHFDNLIHEFTEHADRSLNTLNYISEEEKQKVLITFNDTGTDYSGKTVMELFEEQAARTPDKIALQFGEDSLTYKELNERSNGLAHFLKGEHQVSGIAKVGVMLERSLESVISMIGVMKTGACYVPIDHAYPADRVSYIVKDSELEVIISEEELWKKHGLGGSSLVDIKTLDLEKGKKSNPEPVNSLEDGSYVIYTSGSTGRPKGVLQTHRMMSNLIQWDIHHSGIATGLKHLQYASFSFDASLHDLYFVLSSGGSACIVKESSRLDYQALREEIVRNEIEVVSMPFSALNAFCIEAEIDKIEHHSIKYIVSTAEQLYVNDRLSKFLASNAHVELHNHYGPSETHVVTSYKMSAALGNIESRASIGKPVSNCRIYILDRYQNLVPEGVEGELYIGGDHLALGYLNKPELTEERFVKDPFKEGKLLYRTGDQGYWRTDGTIEFIGRKDDQVKIRGYRIELGEIEHALQNHNEIEEAVVLAKENQNTEKELVAYITSKKEQNTSDLRLYLKTILPEYMLPVHYIQLESLPLTGNGKIDKKALPDPKGLGLSSGVEYVAARNETEQKLVKIWEEVLQRENIGVKDDFFALGGHSLKAIRMINQINKQFSLKYDLRGIYDESTIELIAQRIKMDHWFKKSKVENENDYSEVKI